MSAETEDACRDLVVWYFENRNRLPKDDLAKRLDFMDKAMKTSLGVIAMLLRDVQELEQRKPRPQIWLPSEVKLDDGPAVALR